MGTWSLVPSDITRQWLRDGQPVSGEAGPAFTPQAADVGHQLSCRVTAILPAVLVPFATASNAIAIVEPAAVPLGATGPAGPSGPRGARGPTAAAHVAFALTSHRARSVAPLRLRYAASGATAVIAELRRGGRVVLSSRTRARPGANTLVLRLPRGRTALAPGRYVVALRPAAPATRRTVLRLILTPARPARVAPAPPGSKDPLR